MVKYSNHKLPLCSSALVVINRWLSFMGDYQLSSNKGISLNVCPTMLLKVRSLSRKNQNFLKHYIIKYYQTHLEIARPNELLPYVWTSDSPSTSANRLQSARIGDKTSSLIILNTGVPRSCIPSSCYLPFTTITKFAIIVGQISNKEDIDSIAAKQQPLLLSAKQQSCS